MQKKSNRFSTLRLAPMAMLVTLNASISTSIVLAQEWVQTSAPSREWTAVASSADGTRLVAVGGDSFYGTGWIYTSGDGGLTWTSNSVPPLAWKAVASSADGKKLAAVAFGGGIYTSANGGITWTSNNAPSKRWSSIASSADGSRLVAVASSLAGGISGGIYTNSGTDWLQTSAPDKDCYWESVAASSDGVRLAAVASGYYANGQLYRGGIFTSENSGATWISNSLPSEPPYGIASSADGTRLVMVIGGGPIFTSTDSGATWISNSAPLLTWRSVASSADGTKLAAAGTDLNGSGSILTSSDSGATWNTNDVPDKSWSGIASSADGRSLVAASTVYYGPGLIYSCRMIFPSTPVLSVSRNINGHVVVFWPASETGWNLQQCSNLSAGIWNEWNDAIADDGTNKSITISSPTENQFFRLRSQP